MTISQDDSSIPVIQRKLFNKPIPRNALVNRLSIHAYSQAKASSRFQTLQLLGAALVRL